MYTFVIKEEGPDLEIIITRSMLALAAMASLFFPSASYFAINIFAAVILLFAAVFIKALLIKLKGNKMALLLIATLVLFIATYAITLPIILLVFGYLAKFFKKQPVIQIVKNGVKIKKLFSTNIFEWNDFSNIVFKDNLLTLDFKNNHLIQLKVDETQPVIDEHAFNEYCKRCI